MGQKEYCKKCGIEIFPFSSKFSASKSDYFCVKCAEAYDKEYLIKNSCAMCSKLLSNYEVKVVLPSKHFGESSIEMNDRLSCLGCYTKVAKRNRTRRTIRNGVSSVSTSIRRSLLKGMMNHNYALAKEPDKQT